MARQPAAPTAKTACHISRSGRCWQTALRGRESLPRKGVLLRHPQQPGQLASKDPGRIGSTNKPTPPVHRDWHHCITGHRCEGFVPLGQQHCQHLRKFFSRRTLGLQHRITEPIGVSAEDDQPTPGRFIHLQPPGQLAAAGAVLSTRPTLPATFTAGSVSAEIEPAARAQPC